MMSAGRRAPSRGCKARVDARTERRNVVLVHLESIRARSVTPYNEQLKTTPFWMS